MHPRTNRRQYNFSWRSTLKRWRWFLLLTVLLWCIMLYLNNGHLYWPQGHNYIELFFLLLQIEVTYWALVWIIFIVQPRLKKLPYIVKISLEVTLVLVAGLVCLFLFNYLPQYLILGESITADQNIRNIRAAFVFSPITSLLFFYLLEGIRNREIIQKEQLRISTLEKENYKAQLKLLQSQLSPHFLFNSLNVLIAIIPTNPEKGVEYTHRLSDLYRHYLQSAKEELVSLKSEIEIIDSYCYLIKTRFGDHIKFQFNIANQDRDKYKIPPGALQECIENAIKHNGATKENPLCIFISLIDDFICIKNNLSPRKENKTSTKIGWENITQRYKLLSDRRPYLERNDVEYKAYLPLIK